MAFMEALGRLASGGNLHVDLLAIELMGIPGTVVLRSWWGGLIQAAVENIFAALKYEEHRLVGGVTVERLPNGEAYKSHHNDAVVPVTYDWLIEASTLSVSADHFDG